MLVAFVNSLFFYCLLYFVFFASGRKKYIWKVMRIYNLLTSQLLMNAFLSSSSSFVDYFIWMNETKFYIDWGLRWQTNLNVSRIFILMIFQRMAVALTKIHTNEDDEKFFSSNFHMNEYKKILLKIYRSFFSVLSKSWFIDSHDIVNIHQIDSGLILTRRIFAFDHQTWISRLIFCF